MFDKRFYLILKLFIDIIFFDKLFNFFFLTTLAEILRHIGYVKEVYEQSWAVKTITEISKKFSLILWVILSILLRLIYIFFHSTFNEFWSIFWSLNLQKRIRVFFCFFTILTVVKIFINWASITDSDYRRHFTPITNIMIMHSLILLYFGIIFFDLSYLRANLWYHLLNFFSNHRF